MAQNFCGFALLFLWVIIYHFSSEFVQAMDPSDNDCPSDAPCGAHKSDYTYPSKSNGYLIRHNGMVCVCHPRRLPQEKPTMFVVNKPTEQKQSITIKRSLADNALSYESDCPADAPCGTQESDYTYSKRYGYCMFLIGLTLSVSWL
ncbi:hypothetical protein Ddc_15665 [Ditylenchus destructor]|nr:hypothetical protein Ddc_15665 [Ditylenchus destructor]